MSTAISGSGGRKLWPRLLVLVPLLVALGSLSGLAAGSGASNPWFAALVKPAIYPQPATFGIVWTILYALMGAALALVLVTRSAPARNAAVAAFAVQLVLNLAWSPVFFAAHRIVAAQVVIFLLDIAVIVTVRTFWRVRPLAGMLLLPYLGWVLFATFLNWSFLQANPGA